MKPSETAQQDTMKPLTERLRDLKSRIMPGPWNAMRGTLGGYWNIEARYAPDRTIATVDHGNDADAELIALAPELLALVESKDRTIAVLRDALRHAMNGYDQLAKESPSRNDERFLGYVTHADGIRAVLAKLDGLCP